MRWSPGRDSGNVEDRRGAGGFGMAPVGIGGSVILLVLSLIFGRDFMGSGDETAPNGSASGEVAPPVNESAAEKTEVQLVRFVFDTAQVTWSQVLTSEGTQWRDAKLVLFRDATQTGCGVGQTAMGPFYCPNDQKIYIDLAFYDELRNRFGAPGDFAEAYVITHELGHHVQHLLGTDAKVRRAQEQNPDQANALSVALELQADCYSGVWAHHTKDENILQPGDIDEGLNAAAAVGDDRIQKETTGRVNVDRFTHGSSQQRASWFKRGFQSGDPAACNTFAERSTASG
jgi:predicted metalloprotease